MSETQARTLPDHLTALPGGSWALWRCVCLRGAGFPASRVLDLSAPDCAAAADRQLEAEAAVRRSLTNALGSVNLAIDRLRERGEWHDRTRREPLIKAMRLLKAGQTPDYVSGSGPESAEIAALKEAISLEHASRERYRAEFDVAASKTSNAILEIAGGDRFREAVIWQNRRAFHSGVGALIRKTQEGSLRGSKQRQYEELVANYLQRYCVKNDTIGFFGPVGWATFVDGEAPIEITPGNSLVTNRKVYFEGWCMDAVAEKLNLEPGIRKWLCPRRHPSIYLDHSQLFVPGARPVSLSPKDAAVLALCNDELTAKEIVDSLLSRRELLFSGEEEIYLILDRHREDGFIEWKLELPVETDPEETLREKLNRIEEPDLKERVLAGLDELVQAKHEVERSAGEPGRLDRALAGLEEKFTTVTGIEATRSHGQTYAARTLVYEDSRRDVDVRLGRQVVEELGLPLTLLLQSARWLTAQAAILMRKEFLNIYSEAARRTGKAKVDGSEFWMRMQPMMEGDERPVATLLREFQRRWAEVLDIKSHDKEVRFTATRLKEKVENRFPAGSPGWVLARYHSPDIMIAAASDEAIKRGDYLMVMGELHIAVNTQTAELFLAQHPSREALIRNIEIDLPETRLAPVLSKRMEGIALRTRRSTVLPNDFRVALSSDSFDSAPGSVTPISAMVVEYRRGNLSVSTHDGKNRFDIVEAFGELLSSWLVNYFHILPPQEHVPRVMINRLVIVRETWSPEASELAFAREKEESQRFLQARKFARSHGMPRFVFVKTPVERKPFYVDFDSPIYVNIFARLARKTVDQIGERTRIVVTEMLPGTDQVWLRDKEGNRYTSELRIVAVDM
jgi:hypothetical protein